MSLPVLADEILVQICEIFTENQSPGFFSGQNRRTLLALSRCSHWLNSLVTPMLYRNFLQTDRRTTNLFIERVLDEPGLAKYVTSFCASDPDVNHSERCWDLDTITFDRVRVPIEVAFGLEPRSEDWFPESLTHPLAAWDIATAVILVLLPNLEEIQIPSYCNSPRIDWVVRQSVLSENCLRKVNFVWMDSWDFKKENLKVSNIIPLLRLGKVECAEFEHVADVKDPRELPQPFTLDNLRSLCLIASNLDWSFSEILQRCPKLHSFISEDGQGQLDPSMIGTALSLVKTRLDNLSIKYTTDTWTPIPMGPIGPLLEFKALRVLEIDATALLWTVPAPGTLNDIERDQRKTRPYQKQLVTLLPESLEKLRIIDCWNMSATVKQIRELLAVKGKALPLLKDISLRFAAGGSRKETKELEGPCRSAGIALHILWRWDVDGYVAQLVKNGEL